MAILAAILLAACVLGAAAYFIAKNRAARLNNAGAPAATPSSNEAPTTEAVAAKSWKITTLWLVAGASI